MKKLPACLQLSTDTIAGCNEAMTIFPQTETRMLVGLPTLFEKQNSTR